MRICSLLPSATEIVFALGLGDDLVAVTHECDHPPRAREKAVAVKGPLEGRGDLSSAEIDRIVGENRAAGKSTYLIDAQTLREARPDLIITQGLCEVCAVAESRVVEISEALDSEPRVLSLSPATVEEILDSVTAVGAAAGAEENAAALVGELRERIRAVAKTLENERYRPRVFCLEWLDPPYAPGHWVPDMVETAGGECVLGKTGEPSFRTDWDGILESAPEYVIVMPCGFDVDATLERIDEATSVPQWHMLPAVRKGHCYAVDANSYFSRPSPRTVEGIELLAGILHPDLFGRVPKPDSVLNLKNHFYLQAFLG